MTKSILIMSCLATVWFNAAAIEILPYPYKEEIVELKTANSVKHISTQTNGMTEVIPPKLSKYWSMDIRDVTYFSAFSRWAKEANYQIRWDAPSHFYIGAIDTYQGTFEEAIEAALGNPAIANSRLPLEVCFYPNTPPLARITRKGEQELECN